MGKILRKAIYLLSDIVILALGAFCLLWGINTENHILAGIGVSLGLLVGGIGVAIFLELTNLGRKLLGWWTG